MTKRANPTMTPPTATATASASAAPPAAAPARPVLLAAAPPRALPLAVPVVGIGASAGGLEAIIELLASVPADSGLAFVVVQHLDPTQKGMLPELLQRVTAMPVRVVVEPVRVAANHVYVIAPNKDLSFVDGALTALAPRELRGHRRPIDFFFQSLAEELRTLAAGVVLSGMGADGTQGLAAIKQNGGLTLAQTPASAKFEPMPQSAIAAGVVDVVAAPDEMMARLLGWWGHHSGGPLPDPQSAAGRRASLQQLFQLLLRQTGANFSDYKMNTLLRRIERRMKLCQIDAFDTYVAFLGDNPAELDLLFKELLIGVTSFFRDPKIWDYLRTTALPQLLADTPEGAVLKAWVPACSTGEEAYSLAIVFHEVLEALKPEGRYALQIFATDLDPDAIDRARQGVFGAAIEADVGPERLRRYFLPVDGGGYRIRKELRNAIIFAPQNIISDPPFTKLDILCCRNLLIYFNVKLQDQLIPLFHYALKPGGLLVFGSADTPGRFTELFVALPGAGRVYQRLDASRHRVAHHFPTRVASAPAPLLNEPRTPPMNGNIQSQVEQQLLKSHTPAAVLVNAQGDILFIHGRTGAFLEPAAGKANWNIHAMARAGLRYELADLLKRAGDSDEMVCVHGLILKEGGGPGLALDLCAQTLADGEPLAGMTLLTFASVPLPPQKRGRASNPRLQELEQQLAQARLEVQAVRAEMQTSREELKSANEELQSTNEELQSTNEELTTSKEEMQSLNEELHTVNVELQSKVDDLSLVNGDMKNLLNSTDIATIFLDNSLHIRRFTNPATQIYKLIPGDLNRPLGDIANDLVYPELQDDAEQVLRTLVFCERQIPSHSGRWYTVRIMPYRTVDNVIDGVVVTFINITESKHLEAQLRAIQGDVGKS